MKIYKYQLTSFDCIIEMPIGEIKHVNNQNNEIMLWALVDSNSSRKINRHFKVFPTGGDVEGKYIGTVLQVEGAFVWHVFELEK